MPPWRRPSVLTLPRLNAPPAATFCTNLAEADVLPALQLHQILLPVDDSQFTVVAEMADVTGPENQFYNNISTYALSSYCNYCPRCGNLRFDSGICLTTGRRSNNSVKISFLPKISLKLSIFAIFFLNFFLLFSKTNRFCLYYKEIKFSSDFNQD
jgi:hypothetical protein